MLRATLSAIAACTVSLAAAAAGMPGNEVWTRSKAQYAALTSYADSGTVVAEYRSGEGPADIERHTFTTLYAAPRQFKLDFHKTPASGNERFVLWGEGEDFNTWWSATQARTTYGRGQGATAFAIAVEPTAGASTLVPALLFAKAELQGPLANVTVSGDVTKEDVDGHHCYRLRGHEAITYGTGNVAGARNMTIWIDVDSLLVRKVFEDTPDDSGADTVMRVTTTLQPEANPRIEPARFHFDVPGERK